MKTYVISIIAILFGVAICKAQTTNQQKLNAISFELGKTGLIYNLNIDHKPAGKKVGFRFGVGSNLGQYLTLFSVGGGGYYLVGNKNKFFELGLDIQYLSVNEVSNDQKDFASLFVYPDYTLKTIYPSLNLGYRRYGAKGLFRVGISPGIIDGEVAPGGYISWGWLF